MEWRHHALHRAWKSLVRSPWFVLGAGATFALGVGINIAVFSSVDRMLFRPLPFRDPDRLFVMQQIDLATGQPANLLPAKYVSEAQAQLDVIEDMAILGDSNGWFDTPDNGGQEVRVSFVTSRMLDVAGVRPVMGRGFTDEDERLDRRVVMLTFEAWRGRFQGDPAILGRRLWQRDQALDVIGILPEGYIPSGPILDPDVAGLGLMRMPNLGVGVAARTLSPTIRLRAGASRETAQAMLDAMIERLKPQMPAPPGGPTSIRLIPLRDSMFGQSYTYLWLVTGAAALVLLITCANLAALFLVRGRSRLRNAAVRLSLGATRASLVGDAMAEGLLVCLAGAGAAVVALKATTHSLEAVLPPIFGRYSAGVDGRVAAFALVTAAVACIAASALPEGSACRSALTLVVRHWRSSWQVDDEVVASDSPRLAPSAWRSASSAHAGWLHLAMRGGARWIEWGRASHQV